MEVLEWGALREVALLAKWAWGFSKEEGFLWSQIIRSIHGQESYDWQTKEKFGNSLKSPWISISRRWRKVDTWQHLSLEMGPALRSGLISGLVTFSLVSVSLNPLGLPSRQMFWLQIIEITQFSMVYQFPLIAQRWRNFGIPRKAGVNFGKSISDNFDKTLWLLEPSGKFSVKSLTSHLSLSSPINGRSY